MTTADATDQLTEAINDQTAALVEAMTALTDVLRQIVQAVDEIGS
jgi:ABC-type transporter Mla subunit MlaD